MGTGKDRRLRRFRHDYKIHTEAVNGPSSGTLKCNEANDRAPFCDVRGGRLILANVSQTSNLVTLGDRLEAGRVSNISI